MSLPSWHFVVIMVVFLSSETAAKGFITCTLLRLFIESVGTEKNSSNVHNNPKVPSRNKNSTYDITRSGLQSFVHHSFYEAILHFSRVVHLTVCLFIKLTRGFMQMCYARRYSQHVSQSPDDCEGCVTTRITNFTAKAYTWPRVKWVESIERQISLKEQEKQVFASSLGHFRWLLYICM